jgi:hypothetical protein
MCGRTCAAHGDAGAAKLIADGAPMNAQLETDLTVSQRGILLLRWQ